MEVAGVQCSKYYTFIERTLNVYPGVNISANGTHNTSVFAHEGLVIKYIMKLMIDEKNIIYQSNGCQVGSFGLRDVGAHKSTT